MWIIAEGLQSRFSPLLDELSQSDSWKDGLDWKLAVHLSILNSSSSDGKCKTIDCWTENRIRLSVD